MNIKRKLVALFLAGVMVIPRVSLGSVASAAGSEVAINTTNFPDEVFRTFVNENYNKDGNTSLSEEEIAKVKTITVSGMGLTSLKGVEFFTGATTINCSKNNLTALDVSKNTQLKNLDCSENLITALDVSKCSELEKLLCGCNCLTDLDCSNLKKLNQLQCQLNNLKSLNVKGCDAVSTISAFSNNLTSVDVKGNAELTNIMVNDNLLKSLDLSGLAKLTSVTCGDNSLTEINLKNCSKLWYLECYNNNLTKLDLSSCVNLNYLHCERNGLTSLDPSKNPALTLLNCSANKLTSLDVSANPELLYLTLTGNNINKLDVSKCTKLKYLYCFSTAIGALDLTNCPNMYQLYINCNCKLTGAVYSRLITYHVAEEGKWTPGVLDLPTVHDSILQYCSACGNNYSCIDRLYGDDRYDTSIATAERLRNQMTVNRFDCIVVASGTSYADALSGSYFAYTKNAPILLTANSDSVMNKTLGYIESKLKPGGKVYILGGTGVVSEKFEEALDEMEIDHKRLAGENRYETNLAILRETNITAYKLVVCTGTNFADSLSASGAAMPVLLVPGKLTDSQKAYLSTEMKLKHCLVLGGTGAVPIETEYYLSRDVGMDIIRIAGKDRYETSLLFAKNVYPLAEGIVLAYAQNFPDGLCGGPLAARLNYPLILTSNNNRMVEKAALYFRSAETRLIRTFVLGGTTLISDENAEKIASSF